jgi:hypothetical protein
MSTRPALAQQDFNGLWWGRSNAQDFNGLWWGQYNAFVPSPDVAPGVWWDHYQPPANPVWNGPYYTVPHWQPYVPRPVEWTGLDYGVANAPPQSTRPNGWYGPMSPGPRGDPVSATEFWRYIWPNLSPQTRQLIRETVKPGVAPPEPAAAPTPASVVPEAPRRGFKQYYKPAAAGPVKAGWTAREAPMYQARPAPRVARSEPQGFTQYYRPAGQGRWTSKSARAQ